MFAQTVRQIAEAHGIDAVDKMLRELEVRMEVTGMDFKDYEHLLKDYELIPDGDKRFLQLRVSHRLNILFELAQYSHAKLRSVETKGTVDYNFNVTIKQFPAETNRLDVIDVTPKQLSE